MKYLCIGKKELSSVLFNQPTNNFFNKPNGGLWGSVFRKDDEFKSSWHEWCSFNMPDWAKSYGILFGLKETARVYTIDSYEDLVALQKKYPINNSIHLTFKTGFLAGLIDFEAMSKDIDAVYLTDKGESNTRFSSPSLYGWDVSSILILNFEAISSWEYMELDIE